MAGEDSVAGAVAPIINDVDSTVVDTLIAPSPVAELGLALVLLVLIIIVHGWTLGRVQRFFGARFGHFNLHTAQWRVSVLMSVTIALLALSHLLQTLIWAVPLWAIRIIPDSSDAYFFVLGSYTTLGNEGVTIPEPWRLIGPVIAISGFFTFSWTGSVLVYVMTEIGRRHQKAASAPAPKAQPAPPADTQHVGQSGTPTTR